MTLLKEQGSYELTSFAAHAPAEMERLNAQIDLFWAQELRLYQQLGLAVAESALDCGCGTGYLLEKLHLSFPHLALTGVDIDPAFVNAARERIARNQWDSCSASRQSISRLEFPDATFDFVTVRLVLEHVPDPMPALVEMLRVLKPGGTALLIDNDFDFHERVHPHSAALEHVYSGYRRARETDGGRPCIGRHLPSLLHLAGFEKIDLQVLSAHSRLIGDDAFLKAEGAGIPAQLVKNGFLEAAMLDQVIDEWRAMLSEPDHSIFRMLFAAWGVKPRTPRFSSATPAAINSAKPQPTLPAKFSEDEIRQLIRQTLASELNVLPESLAFDQPLIHQGADSLAAVTLCNLLKSQFSVCIAASDVLSGKSIDDLTCNLVGQLGTVPATNLSIPAQPRYSNS